MAKKLPQEFLDEPLTWVKTNMVRLAICSAEPSNYADITNVRLAEATMASGDFTLAAGDISGRKVTVASKEDIVIDSSGNGTHVVLHDNSSILGPVTTCSTVPLTAGGGNTVNTAGWKIEISLAA